MYCQFFQTATEIPGAIFCKETWEPVYIMMHVCGRLERKNAISSMKGKACRIPRRPRPRWSSMSPAYSFTTPCPLVQSVRSPVRPRARKEEKEEAEQATRQIVARIISRDHRRKVAPRIRMKEDGLYRLTSLTMVFVVGVCCVRSSNFRVPVSSRQ